MTTPTLFVATKALIINRTGQLLLLRESTQYTDGTNAGKFDVPGGRLTPGEPVHDSLLREVHEETGLAVEVGTPVHVGEWWPVVRGEPWQVVGIYTVCKTKSTVVTLSKDHSAYEWIDPTQYQSYDLVDGVSAAIEAYSTQWRTTSVVDTLKVV